MKRLTLALLAVVVAFALAATRPGTAGAQDNTAVAVNTKDGTSIFRLAFKIVRTNKDVVDNANVAFAFASCSECEAVAIAFQAVLIFSDVSTATPTNIAWAQNYECTECTAFAWAYQSVFTTGGPVHFTADGNRRLAELRRALRELGRQIDELSTAELAARLEELQAEFKEIFATALVPAGRPRGDQHDEDTDETDEPETTSEPTETQPAETGETTTGTTETTTEPTETTTDTTTTP